MEGIVIVNKPSGITSFDVVRKLRKILRGKKIGHTGTLDPLATGVLVVCVGKATKLVQEIEAYTKIYVAEFELGYRTDTYDIEGKIVEKVESFNVSRNDILEVLKKYRGKISQVPPMYSALKVQGKKLYELARDGIEIERKAREITVEKLELLEFDGKKAKILCQVSKGTYIRSLIDDIGKDLDIFATMSSLERKSVGDSKIERSFSLETMEKMAENQDFSFLKSVEDFFLYPEITLEDERDLRLFLNGHTLKKQLNNGLYRVYSDRFLGLAKVQNKLLKGYKYF